MSVSVQRRGERHQLRVIHRLLPRPFFFTFDTEVEARNYGEQLNALLARGVVPQELVAAPPRGADDPLVIEVVRSYMKGAPITDSDDVLLGQILPEIAGVRVSGVTFQWADDYVRRLKVERNVAPSTIRKRVGALARALDWHLRRSTPADQVPSVNALRLLPRGYSLYSRREAAELPVGKVVKRDVQRDRRLAPGEEARIFAALAGERRPDRERALQVDPAFALLLRLIVATGMRLREAYRLRVDQIDLRCRIIKVEGSKGHRGAIKPRTVPFDGELGAALRAWCRGRIGLLFPFWDGTDAELKRTSTRLSVRFAKLFDYAGVEDLTEHDLRHEATCRWIAMRDERGGWMFSEIEVCRIMGWSDPKMMLRYASLRGEDLAGRMKA